MIFSESTIKNMKIAFYIKNKPISSVDFRDVENGNPGVGGSEFSAILISTVLCKNKNIETILLCDENSLFPNELKWKSCTNFLGAIRYCKKHSYDYLVVDNKLLSKHIVLRYHNIKFIAWANTFIPELDLHFYSRQPNIVKIVNVGKEQNELYKHLKIYEKSCYIYNAVPTSILQDYQQHFLPNSQRENNVVYIGSLMPYKGFHILAQAWPHVLKEIPNAQLYVIGSGKLYNRRNKLGKWEIAPETYENEFMQHLTLDGAILPSVHFLGILGKQKYDIFSKCKVGVPNPSGVSETFGYTAVEMQLMGCLVTTIKCPGYLDTVYDKANLYESTDQLGNKIVELLKSKNDNYSAVMNYIASFDVNKIVAQWETLLCSLESSAIKNTKITNTSWNEKLALSTNRIVNYAYFYIDVYYTMLKSIIKKMIRRQ